MTDVGGTPTPKDARHPAVQAAIDAGEVVAWDPAWGDPHHHVVDYRSDGWAIQHPLACRPALLDCPIHRAVDDEANGYGDLNLAEWGRWYVEGVTDDGRPLYGASLDGWSADAR